MEIYYITFGQIHTHSFNNITLDKDCVGIIKAISYDEMRKFAFEWFGEKFAMTYTPLEFNDSIKYYPRGFINLN